MRWELTHASSKDSTLTLHMVRVPALASSVCRSAGAVSDVAYRTALALHPGSPVQIVAACAEAGGFDPLALQRARAQQLNLNLSGPFPYPVPVPEPEPVEPAVPQLGRVDTPEERARISACTDERVLLDMLEVCAALLQTILACNHCAFCCTWMSRAVTLLVSRWAGVPS